MITLTLATKRVFRTVGHNRLPEGKALRLVRAGRTKSGASRVGILVGEPEVTDRPVIHEGRTVAWVSARVMEAYDGCILCLEEEVPEGVGSLAGRPMHDEMPARIGTVGGVLGCLLEEAQDDIPRSADRYAGEGAPRPSLGASARAKGHDQEQVGRPNYVALDVLLDDRRLELFWHHELEEIAERA